MKFGIAPINKDIASPDAIIEHARLAEQAGVPSSDIRRGAIHEDQFDKIV